MEYCSQRFFKSMADEQGDLDLDVGMLIPSGGSPTEKVTWKPSLP